MPPEVKHVDRFSLNNTLYWATDNSLSQSNFTYTIFSIEEGTGDDQRIGRKVNGGWFKLKTKFEMPDNWYDIRIRATIVRVPKAWEAGMLDLDEMFETASDARDAVTSWWKRTTDRKFIVLKDKMFHFTQNDDDSAQVEQLERSFEFNYGCRTPRIMEWNGSTTAHYSKGHYFYILTFSYKGPYARTDNHTTTAYTDIKSYFTDP